MHEQAHLQILLFFLISFGREMGVRAGPMTDNPDSWIDTVVNDDFYFKHISTSERLF